MDFETFMLSLVPNYKEKIDKEELEILKEKYNEMLTFRDTTEKELKEEKLRNIIDSLRKNEN